MIRNLQICSYVEEQGARAESIITRSFSFVDNGMLSGIEFAHVGASLSNITLVTGSDAGLTIGAAGSKVGFYGKPPIAQQTLVMGSTSDKIILALQNLGLVKPL